MKATGQIQDPRFSQVTWDPKFKRMPKRKAKVKIDKRFSSMFTEPKFKVDYELDKRGRPLHKSSGDDLKRFYDLESSSESEERGGKNEEKSSGASEADEEDRPCTSTASSLKHVSKLVDEKEETGSLTAAGPPLVPGRSPESDAAGDASVSEGEEEQQQEIRLDLARGGGNVSTSEESDSDWERDAAADSELEHKWGELDADALRTLKATARIAVCNMDWRHVTAKDLFALFTSFKPTAGLITAVKIYQSEFGREQMAKEEVSGPVELFSGENDDSSDGAEKDEPEDERNKRKLIEKIRLHELNRLRYFYAVVECDSVETATAIYDGCDGVEYETSSTKLDLRFIPEAMTFDDSFLTDEASSTEDFSHYRPAKFVNAALQHTSVPLSWEETDDRRKIALKEAFDKVANDDYENLHNYIASSSSEESAEAENDEEAVEQNDESEVGSQQGAIFSGREAMRVKYRQLLEVDSAFSKRARGDVDLKVDFEPGLDMGEDGRLSQDEEMVKGDERAKRTQVRQEAWSRQSDEKPDGKSVLSGVFKKRKKLDKDVSDDLHFTMKNGRGSDDVRSADKKKVVKNKSVNSNRRSLKPVSAEKVAKEHDGKPGFQVNVLDERFEAIYSNALYNIDPSEVRFKSSETTEMMKMEKRRRQALKQQRAASESAGISGKVDLNAESVASNEVDSVQSLVSKLKSRSAVFRQKVPKQQ